MADRQFPELPGNIEQMDRSELISFIWKLETAFGGNPPRRRMFHSQLSATADNYMRQVIGRLTDEESKKIFEQGKHSYFDGNYLKDVTTEWKR